jgi:sec-independent protein translocase protein TatA
MILGITGPWQIVLIVVVILLLFGGRKIPELMKGLGKGMKEFKDATKGEDNTSEEEKK